jgi:hypothetical protein
MERNVSGGGDRLPHIAIAGVADHADHLKTEPRSSTAVLFFEPFPDGIFASKALFHERLVNDGDARSRADGSHVVGPEIPAVDQGNAHRVSPFGRNGEEIAQNLGRRAVGPNESIPTGAAQQRPSGERDRLDAGKFAQVLGGLIPDFRRLRTLGGGFENHQSVRGKPGGLIRHPVERGDK